MAPTKNGKVLSPDEFNRLPKEEQEQTEQRVAKLQKDVEEIARQMPGWRREQRDRVKALNDEVALSVGHLMEGLQQRYHDLPPVVRIPDRCTTGRVGQCGRFSEQGRRRGLSVAEQRPA
ncbi:MAG: hypothetical protein R3F37_18710 [Candidatus Competibacteraceae bacterium]